MTLKEAKDIFEEIAELCTKIDDHNLSDALESIYMDSQKAKSPQEIVDLVSDLMFYVDEITWDDQEIEEYKAEIQELYNKLLDEIE
ncbi:MAG: hypothetical protein KatS3mg035_0983 [Bacteroidia bacterium]|nr:MAG: hypothetical protein KatS3mg035_0983 [Bacteroidia bacterium]